MCLFGSTGVTRRAVGKALLLAGSLTEALPSRLDIEVKLRYDELATSFSRCRYFYAPGTFTHG